MTQIKKRPLCLVVGMPRSATTLLARNLLSHSSFSGLIEPYQTRRVQEYSESSLDVLWKDFKCSFSEIYLIKETSTRIKNMEYVKTLLLNELEANRRCCVMFILRCPIQTFLSQAEASKNKWGDRKDITVSEKEFESFFRTNVKGLNLILTQLGKCTYRITTYNRLLNKKQFEVNRLVSTFGIPPEPFNEYNAKSTLGGDPKSYKNPKISSDMTTDRMLQETNLMKKITDSPYYPFIVEYKKLADINDYSISDREMKNRLNVLFAKLESFRWA